MADDNPLKMTGSMILSLIWTFLVSMILFALAGCSGSDSLDQIGHMSISASDASVDAAATIPPSPRQLHLLEYQQGRAALTAALTVDTQHNAADRGHPTQRWGADSGHPTQRSRFVHRLDE